MILNTENILLVGSILLLISIVAGKTSYKFGVPTLVLFLVIGMLAGSDGIGDIHFDDPNIAQLIGVISLNFILFSGGLDTNWKAVKPILKEGISLSTVGRAAYRAFVWAPLSITLQILRFTRASCWVPLFPLQMPQPFFSILRSKNLDLKNNLKPTLELESGSNDPHGLRAYHCVFRPGRK